MLNLIVSIKNVLSIVLTLFKDDLFTMCLVYCQTLGLVLRLRVDFVLPLSQEEEQQQEEQEEQEQEPPTKIYQLEVY